ncbi:carboxypeptidase-like regulatory domain-containing protein [Tengunoibacter tsumagoiensis]|uniref:Carboxypeptidase regulatory-like domain-containing protein n=1 Tax=Tengunoibacter tsumagoiensis TaxID=2014871 RepID=A0A402A5T2_9CHLR|nr:carboxypeptidase-like regulatory domain-containing protein [Tengunoibacter tsumagoiensis]GCE14375.1 hypothetical protein KTT_42340 [Tengunoibacter tsumagoiensis]
MSKHNLSGRVFLSVLLAGFLFSLLGLTTVGSSLSHAASGNGHIYGRLLDGSNKNAPLANQVVTLQTQQGSNSQDFATATTDAQGQYSFANLPNDKTTNYALYIRYQGAQYVSDLLTLDSKPEQQVDLTVYEATADASNIAVVSSNVLIHAPDQRTGTVTISEVIDFQNLSSHAYVGSLDGSKGKPNALLFTLPPNVVNKSITLDKGFSGYQVIQVDRGFATDAALMPGPNEFTFSYEVPYSGSEYSFTYDPQYPTVVLSLLVPPSLQATSSTLQPSGLLNADQQPYRLFKAEKLQAHQTIQLSLAGLPTVQKEEAPAPLNTPVVWLIVSLLVMSAILVLTWFLYRSRRRRVGGIATKGAQSRQKVQTESELDDARQRLLQELLKLDQKFEAGNIEKAHYEEQRKKLKARLRTLMREQEIVQR